jgi:hypothetical protein
MAALRDKVTFEPSFKSCFHWERKSMRVKLANMRVARGKILIDFPATNLKPQSAKLSSDNSSRLSIEVIFAHFSVVDPTDAVGAQLAFDAPLRADFTQLLATDLTKLQNRIIDFPTNPEDWFIDASLYFSNVHNPIDITRIEFGSVVSGGILLTVTSHWLMSFEGTGFKDFDYKFTVLLSV